MLIDRYFLLYKYILIINKAEIMDYQRILLQLKNKTYAFAGFAVSFFGVVVIGIIGLLVLLIISISFGWTYLSGIIFTLSAILLAGFCFVINAIMSVFGKGRSMLLGAMSLYLNLMSTLAFSVPDFFSGLGMQKWFSMSTIFFVFATGGGVALISFEKLSKIVSLIIVALNTLVFIPNNSFVRGLVGVVSAVGNVFSGKLNDIDQSLTPTSELIRQRYMDDYNKRKHELITQSDKGLITAEEYARQLSLLEDKYNDQIHSKAEFNQQQETTEKPLSFSSSSQIPKPKNEEILSNQLWDSFGIKVEDLDENSRKQYNIPMTVESGAIVVAAQSKFLRPGDVLYGVFLGNYQIAKGPIKGKRHLLQLLSPALPWVPVNSGIEGQCFVINFYSYDNKAPMTLSYCYRSL